MAFKLCCNLVTTVNTATNVGPVGPNTDWEHFAAVKEAWQLELLYARH